MFDRIIVQRDTVRMSKQIDGMVEILKFRQHGGEYFIAVDFSEISSYAMPPFSYLLKEPKGQLSFYREQVALNYLFEEIPSQGRILYLLPPYQEELKEAIDILTLSKHLNAQAVLDIDAYMALFSSFVENKTIKNLLEESSIDSLNEYEASEVMEILKKEYMSLYVLLTIGTRKGLNTLKQIKNSDGFIDINSSSFKDILDVDPKDIEKNGDKKYYDKIFYQRPRNRSINNYRDAIAIEYLNCINSKLIEDNKVMLFVTRTPMDEWLDLKPINIKKDDKIFEVPICIHPIAIFIFLSSVVYVDKSPDIDIEPTIENLIAIKNILDDIGCSYDSLTDHEKTINSIQLRERLNAIDSSLDSVDNLKIALRASNPNTRALIDRIINNIDKQKERMFGHFANRFNKLFNAIENSMDFQNQIKSIIKGIQNETVSELEDISDRIPIELITSAVVSTSPARLTFSDTDIKDVIIKKILNNLRDSEEDPQKLYFKLYEYKNDVCHSDHHHSNECMRGWEAFLLFTQLKIRTRLYKWSLDDCDTGIENAPEYLKPLFKFLKAVVLSRVEENFSEALKVSDELIKDHWHENPRYFLQNGYLNWRGVRRSLEGCSIEAAKEKTEMALEEAGKDFNQFRTCYVLALSNLINFSIGEDNLEKAKSYWNELDKIITDIEQIPMIYYTNGRLLFCNLCREIEETKNVVGFIKKINEIDSILSLLKEHLKRHPATNFVSKIYSELFVDFEEIKSLYHNFKTAKSFLSKIDELIEKNQKDEIPKLLHSTEEIKNNIDCNMTTKTFKSCKLYKKIYEDIEDSIRKVEDDYRK